MNQTIEILTPEQDALISVYQTKWKNVALSIERIKHRKATQAVNQVYKVLGFPPPHVDFFTDPHTVLDEFTLAQLTASGRNGLKQHLGQPLQSLMFKKIWSALHKQLRRQLSSQLLDKLNAQLLQPLPAQLPWRMVEECYPLTLYYVSSNWWAYTGSFFDFCISVLECNYNAQYWKAYQVFAQECGWIYPFETTAFICDRPIQLSVDSDRRLHAEGKPAIQFLGESGIYANHGQIVPC